MKLSDIPTEIERLAEDCEAQLAARFAEIDRVARGNTKRVMEAFQEFRVSEACFAGTTGYGYDDLGRETLDKIWARVFGAEAALVRTGFVNGTHAIASALFAAVGPGELLMPLIGAPYDTLRTAIGITGDAYGSLAFYGVKYAEVPTKDGGPDLAAIEREVGEKRPRAVLIQRSRGYDSRRALSAEEASAGPAFDPTGFLTAWTCLLFFDPPGIWRYDEAYIGQYPCARPAGPRQGPCGSRHRPLPDARP